MDEKTNEKITTLLDVFFLVITGMARILDKLKNGEMKPENVDVQKWIDTLKSLQDLPTN